MSKLLSEGREGGVLIPFPRKLFFSNPSSNPTIPACVAQIEIPFPFFYCFFFHESQSQCTKSHFPASKKGKSQLPFYPFTTLFKEEIQYGSFLIVNLHEVNSIFLLYVVYKNHQNPFYSLARQIPTKHLITEIQNFGIQPKKHLQNVAQE